MFYQTIQLNQGEINTSFNQTLKPNIFCNQTGTGTKQVSLGYKLAECHCQAELESNSH